MTRILQSNGLDHRPKVVFSVERMFESEINQKVSEFMDMGAIGRYDNIM
jgi:hypothetical protein